MRREIGKAGAALVLGAALTLAISASGCAPTSRTAVVAPAGSSGPAAGDWKQIRYMHVLLEAPAAWPVIDLTANPRRCALFNVHAVYLGHQGAEAVCPARALGHTEAVQVEALDATSRAHLVAPAATGAVHGQRVALQPGGSATRSVVAAFPGLGVTVTATYFSDPSTANRIVGSVQSASGGS